MKNYSLTFYPANRLFNLLFLLSVFTIGLGCCRIYFAGNLKGFFLVWNLFLAWIPFVIAFMVSRKAEKVPLPIVCICLLVWLLFLPNAPYLITDLIHLRPRDGVPLWYDAVIFFLFAFHGLLLGLVSTLFIHDILEKYLRTKITWLLLGICFILNGYGIYLGRFRRWNSWDIVANPIKLLTDSIHKVTSPKAIGVTILFTLIFSFSYLLFYQLIHLKNNIHDTKNIKKL